MQRVSDSFILSHVSNGKEADESIDRYARWSSEVMPAVLLHSAFPSEGLILKRPIDQRVIDVSPSSLIYIQNQNSGMRPEDMIDVTRQWMPSPINQYHTKVRNSKREICIRHKLRPTSLNVLPLPVDLSIEPEIRKCAATTWRRYSVGINRHQQPLEPSIQWRITSACKLNLLRPETGDQVMKPFCPSLPPLSSYLCCLCLHIDSTIYIYTRDVCYTHTHVKVGLKPLWYPFKGRVVSRFWSCYYVRLMDCWWVGEGERGVL